MSYILDDFVRFNESEKFQRGAIWWPESSKNQITILTTLVKINTKTLFTTFAIFQMFRVASRIKKPSRLLTLKKSQTVSSLKTENNSWKIEEPEINDSMKIKEEPEIKDSTEIKEEQLLTLSGRDAHFSPEQMIAESEG